MNNLFEKIRKEERIFENENFFIVVDLYPITEKHYLLFYKNEVSSFAEIDTNKLSTFLNEFILFQNESYYFFEAGNNTFCSTFESNYIAHAHLIPSSLLVNFEINLNDNLIQKNIEIDVIKSIEKHKQYLLWGEVGKKFNFIYPITNCTKRFFRTQIQNFIEHGKQNA